MPKALRPEFAGRVATHGEIKERNAAEILEHFELPILRRIRPFSKRVRALVIR
jgi:hypothetical protein